MGKPQATSGPLQAARLDPEGKPSRSRRNFQSLPCKVLTILLMHSAGLLTQLTTRLDVRGCVAVELDVDIFP